MGFPTSRRLFLRWGTISVLAALHRRIANAYTPRQVRIGAIRWDAWYSPDTSPGSSEWYAAHDLDPDAFHYRAPFFAEQVGKERMSINGTQSSIDAEIDYAANAGIDYWAFGWYQEGRPLHKAWEYYQASPQRERVKWCALIGLNSLAQRFPPTANLISSFRQSNYERFGDRPLLYVMHEKTEIASARRSLELIRSECVSAGIGDPYVVIQCSVAKTGASDAEAINADAISAYASAPAISNGPVSYLVLDRFVRNFWTQMVRTGVAVVPNVMTGWDRRPRIRQPPPFDSYRAKATEYVVPGSPNEIANHVKAAIGFVKSHPSACPSKSILIYSWNECDEGGSVLCPTWSEHGPAHEVLDAVSRVLSETR
jgi:hypothetical protein